MEKLEDGGCKGGQGDGDGQGLPEAFVDEVEENDRGEGWFDGEAQGEEDCRGWNPCLRGETWGTHICPLLGIAMLWQ